jgi:hypothetical protein
MYLIPFLATRQAIARFAVLAFRLREYPFATSSHLVVTLHMLFRADLRNFFGQESVMPGPTLFVFNRRWCTFHHTLPLLTYSSFLKPQSLCVRSLVRTANAYSNVIALFTCVNLLIAACQGIKVNTLCPLANSNRALETISTTCRFSITDRTIGLPSLCGRIAFVFSVPL